MKPVLPASFYARPTLEVARDLLGKLVISRSRGVTTAGRIVETEAYFGDDPASHSARRTSRSEIMFGPPGRAYVYFIYGSYEMLNFVTEREGAPGAVLIRALEPVDGISAMARRRKTARANITNGPGRLCSAMGIRMSHNGVSLQGPALAVTVDSSSAPARVVCSPRVGITKATDRYWRFFYDGHPDVSRVPQNRMAKPAARRM